jgi:hypothetical protein
MPNLDRRDDGRDVTGHRIVCGNCGWVYHYPTERCPRCLADPKWASHRNDFGPPGQGFPVGQEPQAGMADPLGAGGRGGERPIDGFGLTLLRFGIVICASAVAMGIFWPRPIYWMVFQVFPEAEPGIYQFARWGAVFAFAYGLLHGSFSIMSWRSGRYWYRNYGKPNR